MCGFIPAFEDRQSILWATHYGVLVQGTRGRVLNHPAGLKPGGVRTEEHQEAYQK